jgi:hypothetical protein
MLSASGQRAPKSPSGHSLSPERLRAARIAVAVQALALLVVIGSAVPGELAYLFHPLVCPADQWCLDFRGLPLLIYLMFLGPPALLLLATVWLWRRQRIWPALLPLVVDAAIIVVVTVDIFNFARTRTAEPNIAVQLLLGLVPALVTLTLVLRLLSAGWHRVR